MDIETDIVERIIAVIPAVQAIYLFGSRAGEKFRPDSDWDIAVLAAHDLSGSDAFFELQLEMAESLKGGVNLVDFLALPIVLQFEVLKARKRIYCADRAYCVGIEAETFSAYQRFEAERRPVIESFIKKRLNSEL